MRLSRDQLVEGLPADQARELMWIFRREPGLIEDATELLGLDEAQVADGLEWFAKASYLEVVRRDRDGTWWFTTIQGNALANASFAKPIYIARCDAMIKTSGRNFGSYLDRLIWPQRQLILYLKDRKPAIDITDENVSALTDRWSSVYNVRADSTAEQPPEDAMIEPLC